MHSPGTVTQHGPCGETLVCSQSGVHTGSQLPDTCLELPTQHVVQTHTHRELCSEACASTHTHAGMHACMHAHKMPCWQPSNTPPHSQLSGSRVRSLAVPKSPSQQMSRDMSSLEVRSIANPPGWSLPQDVFSAHTHTEMGTQSNPLLPLYPASCREAAGGELLPPKPRPYFHLLLFSSTPSTLPWPQCPPRSEPRG